MNVIRLIKLVMFASFSTIGIIVLLGLSAKLFLSNEHANNFVDIYFEYNLPVVIFLVLLILRFLYLWKKNQ